MKILLIEDDQGIAKALRQALASSYSLDHASTGLEGLEKASANTYGIIILDLNLPDTDGLNICQKLRQAKNMTPLLILTGETKVMSKINLLDAGADDYLTKPFSLGELKARIRVLIRRGEGNLVNSNQLIANGLTMDTATHLVYREGQAIELRRKEFALLECLMKHAGTVVTRDLLSNYAWKSSESPWTNTVDVHIKYLRDKIDRPFTRPLIKTVHGLGYKLEAAASSR